LSQVQDGQLKVISYASRLYSTVERRYCVTRKQLLAVVFFLKQFRRYLLGRSFTVRTDHTALQWLRRTPEPIGQQRRWLEILEEFNFTVENRAGKKHENADALSRRPCRQCGVCTPETRATETAGIRALHVEEQPIWSMEEIKRVQESDPDIGTLYSAFSDNAKPPWDAILDASQETKAYWTQWDRLTPRNGVMYRRYSSAQLSETLQLLVSPVYRPEVLRQAHRGFTGGPYGRTLNVGTSTTSSALARMGF